MDNQINQALLGNNIELIKNIQDNSVDAIVTDPPYGISFMSKKWDYDVPGIDIWKECLRVLRPGGYLLSFAGTRTQHRMACNIEDAGFEIRDMIAWIYGSGFPKSLDVGKAIDKLQGNEREIIGNNGTRPIQTSGRINTESSSVGSFEREENIITKGNSEWEGWGTALKPAWESITVARKSIENGSDFEKLFVSLLKQIKKELCQFQSLALIAEKNLKLSQKEQNADVNIAQWIALDNINILEDLSVLMDMLQCESTINTNWNIVLLWLKILEENYCLMSMFTTLTESSTIIELKILNSMQWGNIFQNITHNKEIQKSEANANVWNAESIFTVLKLKSKATLEHFAQEIAMLEENNTDFVPSLRAIIMARKPLSEKTIAENILKWGTGAINIDGSRVPFENSKDLKSAKWGRGTNILGGNYVGATHTSGKTDIEANEKGRFPANLIHDGSQLVLDLFPETKTGAMTKPYTYTNNGFSMGKPSGETKSIHEANSGSAARFFYCAKASKGERNAGCDDLEAIKIDEGRKDGNPGGDNPRNRGLSPQRNSHPTVKPIKLMEYLIRLVSRENSLILDPFAGSGTTGIACLNTGRNFILMERDEHYFEILQKRINKI